MTPPEQDRNGETTTRAATRRAYDSFDSFKKETQKALNAWSGAKLVARWEEIALLAELRQKNKGKDKYVFHDVPQAPQKRVSPSGLIVRMRKDICLKAAALMGFNASYSPSWNMFAGQAEKEALKEENAKRRQLPSGEMDPFDPVSTRDDCRSRAQSRIEEERSAVKRLGVFADWRGVKPHLEARHEAKLLDSFGRLVSAGLMRRELKPGWWCIQCKTELAESEQIVLPRKETGAAARIPLRKGLERLGARVDIAVRAADLWTLPAAAAVALSPDAEYEAVQMEDGAALVVEKTNLHRLLDGMEFTKLEPIETDELLQCVYCRPLRDADMPAVLRGAEEGEFLTRSPDGRMHPNHLGLFFAEAGGGMEPRLAHNYKLGSIMNEAGEMTEEADAFCGWTAEEARGHIALQLDRMGMLLRKEDGETEHPHCWTCEAPAFLRPIDSWRFDASKEDLLNRVVNGMTFEAFPSDYKERLKRSVERQRRWQASRSGVWGLPTPAFYCRKCGEPFDTQRSVKAARDLISHKGTNAWFSADPDDVLPNDAECAECGARDFRKDASVIEPETAALLEAVQNLELRRDNAKIGDIFMERNDPTDWTARLLIVHYALRDGFPTKFVHSPPLKGKLPYSKRMDRTELTAALERSGGSDLFRLLALNSSAAREDSIEEELEELEAQRAEFEEALLRAAYLTRGQIPPAGDADMAALPYLPALFVSWFDTVKTAVEAAIAVPTYDMDGAWRALREALPRFKAMSGYIEAGQRTGSSEAALAERAYYECALQLLKLITPFLPMTAERLWLAAFGAPDGPSLFLSEKLRGSKHWKAGKTPPDPSDAPGAAADAPAEAALAELFGGSAAAFFYRTDRTDNADGDA